METQTIEKEGKTYFIQWDKDKGHIAITECVPEPTLQDVMDYIYELDDEQYGASNNVMHKPISELESDIQSDYEGLETYDFKEE